MEKFNTNCGNCDGWGQINISHHPEPYEANIINCNDCGGYGYTYDIDKIKETIEDIESMISGMSSRIKHFQWTVIQCNRGMLYELADKYENRLESCSRGLSRLHQYRNKLKSLL